MNRPNRPLFQRLAVALSLAGLLTACASSAAGRELAEPTSVETSTSTAPSLPPATTTSTVLEPELAFNGRPVPIIPQSAEEAIEAFTAVERALRIDGGDAAYYADLGHREQTVVRALARNPDWVPRVLAGLPDDLRPIAQLHVQARAELSALHTAPPLAVIPAWRIIEPEPLDVLVGHYRAAEAATGIDWRVLAAINLIETGMGRIDGLSSAGAQGPMQFLPTTWEEVSEGGDIDDPGDAIGGAARYLVRRGGLEDIREGLWGYNNSDNYVDAVLTYVELLELDERALRGFYNWEIYVGTEVGTLWLPVGTESDGRLSAAEYLANNPWARL